MEVHRYRIWENLNGESERLVKILHAYAQASPVPKEVTSITKDRNSYNFKIYTSIPSDNVSGHKNFSVVVCYPIHDSYVEILSNDKVISKVTLEVKHENNMEVILKNFIEIAELYDDPIIQHIISKHQNVTSSDDIKKLIKMHDTSH